jgi:hypothetical protein
VHHSLNLSKWTKHPSTYWTMGAPGLASTPIQPHPCCPGDFLRLGAAPEERPYEELPSDAGRLAKVLEAYQVGRSGQGGCARQWRHRALPGNDIPSQQLQ